jgi:hypothetical protein
MNVRVAECNLFEYLLLPLHAILFHNLSLKFISTSVINGKELSLLTDKILAQF